jgi:hypothetical protein
MSVAVSNCAERPEPTWGQSIFLAIRAVTIPPSPGVIPLPSPRRLSAGGFSFPEFLVWSKPRPAAARFGGPTRGGARARQGRRRRQCGGSIGSPQDATYAICRSGALP